MSFSSSWQIGNRYQQEGRVVGRGENKNDTNKMAKLNDADQFLVLVSWRRDLDTNGSDFDIRVAVAAETEASEEVTAATTTYRVHKNKLRYADEVGPAQ